MSYSADDISALWLTAKLALTTTLFLLLICAPIAWWLAHTKWRFKFILEAIIAMPLVLPPTVLGFYLLILMSPQGWLGQAMTVLGAGPLAFSFSGLVIGSCIYSLPFVMQPMQSAFAAIAKRPIEVAATLGASPVDRFFSIILPIARPGIVTAAVLGFAHTLGEFGVVLMIGGNIPGQTKVVSIAIYDYVESFNYAQAHLLAATLLTVSFVLLVVVYATNRRFHLFGKA